jgi:hypothetical protein
LALPLWGAEDANAIVSRLIQAQDAGDKLDEQYTYVQETRRFRFDKDGRPRQTEWETHEIIFVEGMAYEKLVAREGKPLSAKEQAKVAKDMQETAAYRRAHSRRLAPGGVVSDEHGHSADLGSARELLTLFDNRLTGEEEIRGHKAWVIESTPRSGYEGANEHERAVLSFRKKFWIDEADTMAVRAVYTVIRPNSVGGAGSTLTFDWEKIDREAWEVVSIVANFSKPSDKVFKPGGRTEYEMSKFQKFDVESTVTVGGER